jgi:hypothetical protein
VKSLGVGLSYTLLKDNLRPATAAADDDDVLAGDAGSDSVNSKAAGDAAAANGLNLKTGELSLLAADSA